MKKFLIIVIGLWLVGCSYQEGLEVSGSTSVAPVMEKLISDYQSNHVANINLTADGSSAGISAALEGVSDIGMSSRALSKDEFNNDIDVNIIGIDAIVVVLNKDNKITNLSIQDLHDIYCGKKNNWQDFGGENIPIVLVSRENGSGTRDAFEDSIKAKDANKASYVDLYNPVIVNSTGAVIENVKQKKGAIGYMSMGSVIQDIKAISLNNYQANKSNVIKKLYPISREFYVISKKNNIKAKTFINYILNEDGQHIIENEGFIRVK
ncbi:MAG: phosphate ABC transporter substrate-binding protein [Bacilli bacterium]|jgi:phosphate transport system substrate-binding protein|nr:phosphate ABC transporter substrate-binding protein [Bacilli bacterium]